MNNAFILLFMLFCHIIDDFVIQTNSPLAHMKQRASWEDVEDTPYESDYLIMLMIHALSWAFMIMLPLAIHQQFSVDTKFLGFFLFNALVHGFIDNLKCNEYVINLVEDQTLHICQILFTAMVFLY